MTTTLIISIILIGIFFYPVFFKQKPFKKELENIRKEQLKKTEQEDKDIDKLYIYLNLIINDKNIKIVRKYFNLFVVHLLMTSMLFVVGVFFCTASFSQELKIDLENNDFLGSWSSKETNYVLLIKKENDNWVFINYRFEPMYDENGWKTYKRIMSPGKETFISEKDLEIINKYSIDEQNYYVALTYKLLTDKVIQVNFKGKLNNKPYNRTIIYHKENEKSNVHLLDDIQYKQII